MGARERSAGLPNGPVWGGHGRNCFGRPTGNVPINGYRPDDPEAPKVAPRERDRTDGSVFVREREGALVHAAAADGPWASCGAWAPSWEPVPVSVALAEDLCVWCRRGQAAGRGVGRRPKAGLR